MHYNNKFNVYMSIFFIALLFILTNFSQSFSQNISQGLAGYWALDCNPNDFSGNNLHATAVNNPNCVDGKLRMAYQLSASNRQFFTLPPNRSTELISPNGFSWSVWFRGSQLPTATTNGFSQALISVMDNRNGEDFYLGFGDLTASQRVLVFRADGAGGAGAADPEPLKFYPAGGFNNNEWYHVVAVRDYNNNTSKLFLNGVLVAQKNLLLAPIATNMPASFGVFRDGQDTSAFFRGILDEIKIYDRPLSDKEVLNLNSLRENQLTPQTPVLEFGELICKNDSTLALRIVNEGPGEFIIDNSFLRIETHFEIIPHSEIILDDKDTAEILIRFRPTDFDFYSDTIYVDNPFNVPPLIVPINGSFERLNFEFANTNNDTLDFGEIVLCGVPISERLTIPLSNRNSLDTLKVKTIRFSSQFFSTDLQIGDFFEIEAYKAFDFVFRPSQVGQYSASVEFEFENCIQKAILYLKAEVSDIKVDLERRITLPEVVKDDISSQNFVIRNSGTHKFNVKRIIPPSFPFEFDDFNGELLPNQTSGNIEVRFLGAAGVYSDSAFVEIETPCGDSIYAIALRGVGRYVAQMDIKPLDVKIAPGGSFIFTLDFSNVVYLDSSEVTGINLKVAINQSMAASTDGNETFITFDDENLIMELNIPVFNLFDGGRVEVLNMTAALGNAEQAEFKIYDVNFINGYGIANIQSGSLILDSLCETDGNIRLVDLSNGSFNLAEASPNPAVNQFKINVELIEEGKTSIDLYDANGNFVKNSFQEVKAIIGKREVIIDSHDMKSGVYFCVLKTPTATEVLKVVITK